MDVTPHNYASMNSSAPTNLDYKNQLNWIIPTVVSIILMILTLWILLCLIHYGIKTGKWRKRRASHSDMLNIGLVYTSVLVCAVICLIFFCINLVYLNIGFSTDKHDLLCEIIADSAVACYGLMLFSVAMFLWFRQRVFFRNEMFSMSYTRCVQVLSFSSIFIVFLGALGVLVINILPFNRRSSDNGCLFEAAEDHRVFHWISVVVLVVIGQGMLLGLFAYALIKTKDFDSDSSSDPGRNRLESGLSSASNVPLAGINNSLKSNTAKLQITDLRNENSQSHAVRKILQKTLIFAVLSTLADIFIQVMIHYINRADQHRRYVTTVSNTNAFLNLLFLVLSFVRYKEILMSPCRNYVRK